MKYFKNWYHIAYGQTSVLKKKLTVENGSYNEKHGTSCVIRFTIHDMQTFLNPRLISRSLIIACHGTCNGKMGTIAING